MLGTSVLTPTLRYHPAVVAQQFATLGQVHPGRLILGVGTGESLNEQAIGVEFPELKERFARLRESVRLMRRLWTEERVDFEGDYYATDGATIYDRPAEPIPIYVAGGGPATTQLRGALRRRPHLHLRQGRRVLPRHDRRRLEEGLAQGRAATRPTSTA